MAKHLLSWLVFCLSFFIYLIFSLEFQWIHWIQHFYLNFTFIPSTICIQVALLCMSPGTFSHFTQSSPSQPCSANVHVPWWSINHLLVPTLRGCQLDHLSIIRKKTSWRLWRNCVNNFIFSLLLFWFVWEHARFISVYLMAKYANPRRRSGGFNLFICQFVY